MSFERRRFLKSATLAAVSAGMTLGLGRHAFGQKTWKALDRIIGHPIPIKAQQDSLFYFSEATFRPYLNDIFQAPDWRSKMVALELIGVNGYKPKADSMVAASKARETRAFSLMFKASEPLSPFTTIYKMRHPALGRFDLFMTPRQKDGTFYYEAVFNHI